MKTIRVVAAVIQRKHNGSKQIFATQRGYGEFEGGWEFPGGKIEAGETPQKALIREIKEELDADGNPFTAHTTNVVPLIVTNSHVGLKEGGKLGDLAPTMLQLLGLPIPEEMDGESLLK